MNAEDILKKLEGFILRFSSEVHNHEKLLLEASNTLKESILNDDLNASMLIEVLEQAKEMGTWGYELWMYREILLKQKIK